MDFSAVRGFNYQPSYGSTSFENWLHFDADVVKRELARGKRYFPKMMAVRLWLSWQAFMRDPDRFAGSFESALAICDDLGLVVMPILFNRWHNDFLDCGGIYLDHFLPGASWMQHSPDMFGPYVECIVGGHAADPRVFAWDLCNEPFSYGCDPDEIPDVARAEYAWLEGLYGRCKSVGAEAPVTVGIHPGHRLEGIRQIEPISDILSIHPYWTGNSPPHDNDDYERLLDDYVAFAQAAGKPLLATETCWGAVDDAARVEIIRYTLGQLKSRNIGWLVHLLHHSLVADAHRPEYGPVSLPGNLAFIEADGSLRPGHEVFNEF